ncbi:hypothetical protein GGD41_005055 [Paraburkholderia bryophila]|uniref:Uncharacterized protein n=1 Tax=Paraburkholderia bryophila TaxID=420952 RepID=A0A7Z0B2X9_9BURK|nr:hypothetical protein [Paraburkholderia bryophila]
MRVPIEERESWRRLESMRQSTELPGDPARCICIGDRESDIYELFAPRTTWAPIFSCLSRLAHSYVSGMRRLSDIHLGYKFAQKEVTNCKDGDTFSSFDR